MSNPKEKAVLQLISEDKTYENYFFNKVSNIKWFYPLKEKGYFSSEKAPTPLPAGKEGNFIIPHWNILDYLERISQQITIEANGKYANELLQIIDIVTKYHIEYDRKLDNYHTWWYFVKILINIPNDKIVKYLKGNNIQIGKDWIKEWITSRFDSMLPASDIATKLLPKFLTNNKEDIEIAEQIIDVITDIKEDFFEDEETVQGIILFEKKKEPKTKVDSYWLIESFKKNAPKIGELCSDKIIVNLADKLKKILNKEHNDHQVLIELESDITYRISAKRIKEFEFEISMEKLHHEEIDFLKPEDRYFGVLKVKGDVLEGFPFVIDECRNENTFIEKIKSKEFFKSNRLIFLTQGIDIDKKLTNLYRGLYSDYSSIWYKSLSAGPDVGIHNAQELLVFILRDILFSKCASNISVGRAILDKFLSDEYQYPLFRRFVLLVAGTYWNEYKDLFWKFIEVVTEPFEESDYEVELYKLLQANVDKFDEKIEKMRLKELISSGPEDLRYTEDDKNRREKYIAYWKQKWYSALQKDEYFLKLFEEQKAITGEERIEPPSETAFVETRWGEGASPLGKEDILKMNNADLAKYLNQFKTKDSWKGPTEGGLAEVLKAAVKENPNKFVEELHLFSDVKYRYVYNILYGLEDAWKEKKTFDWGKLFTFAKKYIEKTDFFEKAKEAQGENWLVRHVWIINVMADLIQEGAKDDSWAFPEDYFAQAEEILDISITKLPVEYKEESTRDPVTYALNTSYGRVIMAMILLALRKARFEDKKNIKKEPRWNTAKYENLLQKGVIEAFTFLGWYMPNFAYLNKQWVENKIKEFETLGTEDIKWQSFMEGYLSGHRVYQDLYGLMRSHYIRGIEKDFRKSRTENRLAQHITIGYLRGNESLEGEDSLFKKIIDKWDYSQIGEIVDFFWSQVRYLKEEAKRETEEDKRVKDRIIEFWRWVYTNRDMIKDKLKPDYRKLFSDLSRLAILLEKIDSENSKWLLLSAPHVGVDFNSPFFIEYLDKFEDKESVRFIGKIFLEMLSSTTPDYDQKHIISIVKKIYLFDDKTEADKICDIYGRKGYEFLRPIWEENNKKV